MTAVLREIVFDCVHPARLARFWAAVLNGYAVRPYDAAEVARLAALGLTPETDPVVLVDGPGPSLCFQRVDAALLSNAEKHRLHLDVQTVALEAEVQRLCALGASVARSEAGYCVMLDPERNRFCVVRTSNPVADEEC